MIFDDLGAEILTNLEFFEHIFVVLSHHVKISVFLVLHNLFERGLRKISLNTTRLILTSNLRDQSQNNYIARQSFPRSRFFLSSVYSSIINNDQYGYIILDFSQNRKHFLKVSTWWFSKSKSVMFFSENTLNCKSTSSKPFTCYHLFAFIRF